MTDITDTSSYFNASPEQDEVDDYSFEHVSNAPTPVSLEIAEPFLPLLEPARYKIYYGGRGAAKSWGFARALITIAATSKKRILCCREYQSSMAESVHFLLVDQIYKMGLSSWFKITEKSIYCPVTGSEFIFKGLRLHIHEIRSTEAVDICWIEEAHTISLQSWNVLEPTIRTDGSEIWASFNPLEEKDVVYKRFVVDHLYPEFRKDGTRYAYVRKINFDENPWFPPDLEDLRQTHLNGSHDIYAHIWLGEPLRLSDAMIFKDKFEVVEFEAPEGVHFRFGADFGFANDPTVLLRYYELDNCLWVDYEVCATRVEIDEMPAFFAGDDPYNQPPRWPNLKRFPGIPGAARWPIKADESRPETISAIRRAGLNISGAEKWKNSVEEGIAHLRGFKKIKIHPRCRNLIEEAMLYRYKVDDKTDQVLPVVVDKHNHSWDALRYGEDGRIQTRGAGNIWRALGRQN